MLISYLTYEILYYFRNVWVGMYHWDPGTLNLIQS